MKITVADARAFSQALTLGADEAESQGAIEFDLTSSLQALDDAARQQLADAIEHAKTAG